MINRVIRFGFHVVGLEKLLKCICAPLDIDGVLGFL